MPPATGHPPPATAASASAEAERTVFAGEHSSPIEITYRDGRVEKIVLLDLTYRQLHRWAALAKEDKQPELIELCSGKPLGWSDQLTIESAAALAEVALSVNFRKALKLAKHDLVLGASVTHVFGVMMAAIRLPGFIDGLSATLPELSPAASAEATGSAASISPPAGSPP